MSGDSKATSRKFKEIPVEKSVAVESQFASAIWTLREPGKTGKAENQERNHMKAGNMENA